ncbi:hypothetical protein AB0P05_43110 [Streptomyces flaveolus]|uniref:hypothetical protein n=1 Tax=Streptomyces flaveolus TaxID=67297 RepID=UPI00342A9381
MGRSLLRGERRHEGRPRQLRCRDPARGVPTGSRGGAEGAARLVTTGRRRILRLAHHWPRTDMINSAFTRLKALPNPD